MDYALRAVIEMLREPVVGNHEDALEVRRELGL
jgi:hypothetical protein